MTDRSDWAGFRRELRELAKIHTGAQARMAALLLEVRDRELWKESFTSFADYCERDLKMALRTAQELIKTYAACREAGVPIEDIEQIGWSKVARIATRLTECNKAELMRDAATLSHAGLAEKYSSRPSASGRSNGKPHKKAILRLTQPVLEALSRASSYTHTDDAQQNLEYLAERFIDSFPRIDVFARAVSAN